MKRSVIYGLWLKEMEVQVPPISIDKGTYDYLSRMAKSLMMSSVEELLAKELREKLNEIELWLARTWIVEDSKT